MEVMAGREAKEQPAATAAASGLINLMVSVDEGLQGWRDGGRGGGGQGGACRLKQVCKPNQM